MTMRYHLEMIEHQQSVSRWRKLCYHKTPPDRALCPNWVGLFTGSAFLSYVEGMLVLLKVPDLIDDDEASDELDELCGYLEGRLTSGIEQDRVFQSLLEAVLNFDGVSVEKTQHVLQ